MPYPIGWFSTGRDEAARDLVAAVHGAMQDGLLKIEISFVFSNWEPDEEPEHKDFEDRQEFFRQVESYGIPLVCLSWRRFQPEIFAQDKSLWRSAYGAETRRLLAGFIHRMDVLAGYMLWLDNETCDEFDVINLHPAKPGGPKGTWQQVIWQLIEHNTETQGVMIHLATRDWDEGPPISYCEFSIKSEEYEELWRHVESKGIEQIKAQEREDNQLFKRIRAAGVKREIPLLVHTIKQFADGKLSIEDKRVYSSEDPVEGGYDLTDEIDAVLKDT